VKPVSVGCCKDIFRYLSWRRNTSFCYWT